MLLRLCDDSCSDWCENSRTENYLIVVLICISLIIMSAMAAVQGEAPALPLTSTSTEQGQAS